MAVINQQSGRIQTSLSEINVTPMVDVMLVLLVIFMVTAPILHMGFQVQLPKTKTAAFESPPPQSVIITVTKDGDIYWGSNTREAVNINFLEQLLKEKLANSENRKVYVRGDGDAQYRVIAYVLALCKRAGANVNLVTDPIDNKK